MSETEDWSKFSPEALALVARLEAKHDKRVAELLEANNREVERRRKAEGVLHKARNTFLEEAALIAEFWTDETVPKRIRAAKING